MRLKGTLSGRAIQRALLTTIVLTLSVSCLTVYETFLFDVTLEAPCSAWEPEGSEAASYTIQVVYGTIEPGACGEYVECHTQFERKVSCGEPVLAELNYGTLPHCVGIIVSSSEGEVATSLQVLNAADDYQFKVLPTDMVSDSTGLEACRATEQCIPMVSAYYYNRAPVAAESQAAGAADQAQPVDEREAAQQEADEDAREGLEAEAQTLEEDAQ